MPVVITHFWVSVLSSAFIIRPHFQWSSDKARYSYTVSEVVWWRTGVNMMLLTRSIGINSVLKFMAFLVTVPCCWAGCCIFATEVVCLWSFECSLERNNGLILPIPCLPWPSFGSKASSFIRFSPVGQTQYKKTKAGNDDDDDKTVFRCSLHELENDLINTLCLRAGQLGF